LNIFRGTKESREKEEEEEKRRDKLVGERERTRNVWSRKRMLRFATQINRNEKEGTNERTNERSLLLFVGGGGGKLEHDDRRATDHLAIGRRVKDQLGKGQRHFYIYKKRKKGNVMAAKRFSLSRFFLLVLIRS
jgi:hypothetical protein